MSLVGESGKIIGIISEKVNGWIHSAVAILPNLVVATLMMVGFWMAARFIKNLVTKLLSHTSESVTVTRLIASLVHVTILFFGLFTTLGILNLDKAVTSLLAGAGVLGLAVGFAFQEIAANFFSGILIAIRKPYRELDIVQVDQFVGVVKAITLRTTNLRTNGGLEVLVPNKDMFTKPVTNFTRTPDRRVDVDVGVSYAEDLRRVEKVVRDCVENIPGRMPEKDIEFYYKAFGDSSVLFQVRIWIIFKTQKDYLAAMHHAIIAIKEAFDREGILIPFPIRTLDFGIRGGLALGEVLKDHPPSERVLP